MDFSWEGGPGPAAGKEGQEKELTGWKTTFPPGTAALESSRQTRDLINKLATYIPGLIRALDLESKFSYLKINHIREHKARKLQAPSRLSRERQQASELLALPIFFHIP